jgi:hypothetical protein
VNDPYHYLKLTCDLGGGGSEEVHIYSALATAGTFSCIGSSGLQSVTEGQYLACAAIIENSGPCPFPPPPQ